MTDVEAKAKAFDLLVYVIGGPDTEGCIYCGSPILPDLDRTVLRSIWCSDLCSIDTYKFIAEWAHDGGAKWHYQDIYEKSLDEYKKKWASIQSNPRKLPASRKVVIDALMERDGNTCQICDEPLPDSPYKSIHIDHIQPVIHGGDSRWANLRLTHAACNLARKKNYG